MKSKWRGALIGGVVGFIVSIIFYNMDLVLVHSSCVKGLNLNNFFCSIFATLREFGFITMFFSTPTLFIENIAKLEGFGLIFLLPFIMVVGFLLGGFIGYHLRKNEK